MSDFQNTQQALLDIKIMKQALLLSKNKLPLTVDSIDTHLTLNIAALAIAASVGLGVIVWPEINEDVRMLATAQDARIPALSIVGVGLLSLLTVAYGYISHRARKEKIAFTDFNDKYFSYFKNMSALSDVFVKFCATALVVLAGKPEWLAPLFMLFIGDLVFQGRLLILSAKTSTWLGIACFIAAITAFVLGTNTLLAPASVAVFVSAWSLVNILKFRSNLLSTKE